MNARVRNILYFSVFAPTVAGEAVRAYLASNLPMSVEPIFAGAAVAGGVAGYAVHSIRRTGRRWLARP